MSQFTSPSPPPLRHPVPTHPAYIPEPPSTPASPQGYQRFTSSPAPPGPLQQQQAMGPGPGIGPQGQHQQQQYGHAGFSGPQGRQYAQHGGGGASHLQAYPTHVPAYGVPSPFAHSQAQQQQQQQGVPPPYLHGQMQGSMHPQDAHGQHGGPGFAPPNFAAWGLDGTTAQLGMQLGSSAVAAGQDYMQRNFGTILPSTYIKHHFNVSNSYVITKLRLVLFPWRQKSWARRSRISSGPSGGQGQNQAVQEWMAPREDVNCPDLYIPVMAIFTYVLLTALHAGINDGFNPGILGDSASRATAVVLLDFAFVKLGCYVLNITSSSQVVDLVAYGGYKFVGVILALVASFLGASGALWWLVFVYAFLANAFFLLRSLRTLILPDASTAPPTHATSTVTHAQRRRRIVFLLLEAVLQVGYMGWLVRV